MFINIRSNVIKDLNKKIFPLKHPVSVLYNKNIKEGMIINYHSLKNILAG